MLCMELSFLIRVPMMGSFVSFWRRFVSAFVQTIMVRPMPPVRSMVMPMRRPFMRLVSMVMRFMK